MTSRRTLFIVPSLRRAGAENQVVQLVNGLPDSVFEKHLLSYQPSDELLVNVERDHVTYHATIRRRKIDLSVARAIGKVIDDNLIDIVHCTLENALLYGVLGARNAVRNPRFICAIHTTLQPSWKNDLAYSLIYKHLLKRCAQVWFMCEFQASHWTERAPFLRQRQRIIYNGIRVEDFVPGEHIDSGIALRKQYGIPDMAKVICSVAGLRREKFHDVLLMSFKELCDTSELDCYLLLAGSGPMEQKLRKTVEQLELQSRVIFLGEVSDVRPLLATSDCKVLASAAETFSMAMLEAMAMQVPVICTRVGGAPEAIRDRESGLLITPGDVAELTNGLSWILTDESRRAQMGVAARRSVTRNFTYSRMVEQSHRCLIEAC